ncbi:UNVERIFIED_CONTAM: Guanine nucleotide-binding protein G [Trichonephila clavipes]
MGACLSLDEEERRAQLRSEEIDKQLAELAKQERNVIKILLLGAGESGKSTLVKQMKIIHSDGFTIDELKSFKPTVLDNILSSMKYVLTGMGILRINLENAKNKKNFFTSTMTKSSGRKQTTISLKMKMDLFIRLLIKNIRRKRISEKILDC